MSVHPLDLVFARIAAKNLMFSSGWGDSGPLDRFGPGAIIPSALVAPAIRFGTTEALDRGAGITRTDGWFDSPAPDLPDEIAKAHIRLLARPSNRAVCVVFAGSRDEGYSLRTSIFGALPKSGIDVVFLENPYYGVRRAAGARSANLATVADQARMNVGALVEAIAILRWAERHGYSRLGVAGYSMGGYFAALAGALEDRPLAVAALAAGADPAPVYTVGLLSKSVDFNALGPNDPREARERLSALFRRACLEDLPKPRAPRAAVIVGMASDGYVPAAETERLARYWTGRAPITLRSGHIAGVLTQRRGLRQAVTDAFARL